MTAQESTAKDPAAKRGELNRLLQRFEIGQKTTQNAWRTTHDAVPRRLHHYTTLGGMEGIIESGGVWASDVRYMNDSSELTYASELIEEVIVESLAAVSNEVLKEMLPSHPGFANAFEHGARPFIACFCENEDLLSQWRGYGVGDSAVSLGLDLTLVTAVSDLPPNTFLRKVIYDEEQQRAEVREVVDAWLATATALLSEGVEPTDLFPYPAIWAIQGALVEQHLCFKHPSFSEEREWRLIKMVNVREELRMLQHRNRDELMAATRQRMIEYGAPTPDISTDWAYAQTEGVDIRFRRSRLGFIPYVHLPIRDRAGIFTDRLPLWQVVQGPTTNADLALESLGMFLESRKYGFHTEVKSTGVPLRP